jgi:hypothetical protein
MKHKVAKAAHVKKVSHKGKGRKRTAKRSVVKA